jgi:uncharacterized protein YndB with AHSA1/START domain
MQNIEPHDAQGTGELQDRVRKEVTLRAEPGRVWRAIADAREFGEWFRVDLGRATFAPGRKVRGKVLEDGFEHIQWQVTIEQVIPERLLSFRWHPYAIDAGVDYSGEPPTLVEFQLAPVPGGTKLVLVESGFSGIPRARRDEAFRAHDQGWSIQCERIAAHVGRS